MAYPPKNGNGSSNGNGNGVYLSIGIGIIAALFNAFWGVAWSSVGANITRIEQQLAAKATDIESVRIRENDRVERQLAARILIIEKDFLRLQEHKEFTVRLDSQIAKMENRLAASATRDELDTRLGINSASIIQVRNEVDRLKTDLGQTYPLKEVLSGLGARLDRMEQWSRSPPPHQSQGTQR